MGKLDCKFDELDKLGMSLMSWISCICKFDELAKLDFKLGELDKLGMSLVSWISCTESPMSWLNSG